ncbi:MAG: imidazole glycerol phosphate synthase subunit HisH [Vampirovibrionales bacterium]|nr:imidazole glycerol phosphate synthase subunit HisH [Vampirovibrionales bacterium]
MRLNIVIVDLGAGNLGAIPNMLHRLGATTTITQDPATIASASHVILPGVGAFDTVARQVDALHLRGALTAAALEHHIPFLGICVGMQLLYAGSEEGQLTGLGWFPETLVSFNPQLTNERDQPLRIPHMGWNTIADTADIDLLQGFGATDPRFYFVHSYHAPVVPNPTDNRKQATTHYGQPFVAAVQRENIFGVQFHPEKSHRFGLHLFRHFIGLPSPYTVTPASFLRGEETTPC